MTAGPSARLKTLEVRGRAEWREWLAAHHDSETEIWLVFFKPHAGKTSVLYSDALDEALCFGWIDSLIRRLDDDCYARKFTPRKLDGKWSTVNRRRYAELKAQGLVAAPGLERPPTSRSGDAPRPSLRSVPPYILNALKTNARASAFFETLAPSYRRAYIGWVDSAKQAETKERRVREAIVLLAAGKKLGMK